LRKESNYGHLPNWDMLSVIVKYGDDCRQETLAIQLIRQFQKIMIESKLPLYLRPTEILIISSNSAIIETIPDVLSIHQLKQRFPQHNTIYKYFLKLYGSSSSHPFILAQRNFIESLAGYTIVTYILQVKDRHNGNILLDKEGHLIHIDFGFMLGTNPGFLFNNILFFIFY
jgi:phosphatidylinositol 4-kinase B